MRRLQGGKDLTVCMLCHRVCHTWMFLTPIPPCLHANGFHPTLSPRIAGYFDSGDPRPQLLVAPSSGPQAGRLVVYGSSGCRTWASVPSADSWTALELVDINYDTHHDVLLASLGEVGCQQQHVFQCQ